MDMVVDIINGIMGDGAREGTAALAEKGVMAACLNSNTTQ